LLKLLVSSLKLALMNQAAITLIDETQSDLSIVQDQNMLLENFV